MKKPPRWIVTVRREGAEEVTAKRWAKTTDEPGLPGGQYAEVVSTLTNDVREDVYEQIVEDQRAERAGPGGARPHLRPGLPHGGHGPQRRPHDPHPGAGSRRRDLRPAARDPDRDRRGAAG